VNGLRPSTSCYTQTMNTFDSLPEPERHALLQDMARAAASSWKVKPDTISPLSLETNAIFSVNGDDDQNYVLRITDPWSCHDRDELIAELLWLKALEQDTDLTLRYPVKTISDELFLEIDHPPVTGPRLATLFRKVEGNDLADDLTLKTARAWGRMSAQLHEHAKKFKLPEHLRLRSYLSTFPYAAEGFPIVEKVLVTTPCPELALNEERASRYKQLEEVVDKEIQKIEQESGASIIIHHDLHIWNVLSDGKNLAAIDFEDLLYGYPIQDIAVSLFYVAWREDGKELMAAFREGYEQISPWPESRPGQLELLILGRDLMLVNFLMNAPSEEERNLTPEYLDRLDERIKKL
jgi:Ser/Thr protein kinase RdoA (MazF antagonist)